MIMECLLVVVMAGLCLSVAHTHYSRVRTTDKVWLAESKNAGPRTDWRKVRDMELDLEGVAFHDLEGNLLDEPLTRAELADRIVEAEGLHRERASTVSIIWDELADDVREHLPRAPWEDAFRAPPGCKTHSGHHPPVR